MYLSKFESEEILNHFLSIQGLFACTSEVTPCKNLAPQYFALDCYVGTKMNLNQNRISHQLKITGHFSILFFHETTSLLHAISKSRRMLHFNFDGCNQLVGHKLQPKHSLWSPTMHTFSPIKTIQIPTISLVTY